MIFGVKIATKNLKLLKFIRAIQKPFFQINIRNRVSPKNMSIFSDHFKLSESNFLI